MRHIGLFEGIGGFSLAARWMGWETIAWCENDNKCQQVLTKHFPKAQQHGDIKTTDFTIYRGQCDIVTGGFPCQPYSAAGQRKGKDDDRHLWPEMLIAIREIQPGWVVGENVPGLLNWNGGMVLTEIKADLESEGFEVFPPCILPACGVNAPHRRDRVWFIANRSKINGQQIATNGKREGSQQVEKRDEIWGEPTSVIEDGFTPNSSIIGCNNRCNNREKRYIQKDIWVTKKNKPEREGRECGTGEVDKINKWPEFISEPGICRGDDGFSGRMDRLKQLGNAIVPQVAYQIFKSIQQYEKL